MATKSTTKLFNIFTYRSNAWAVEISRDDYSEHDVANVVKRFVRQLGPIFLYQVCCGQNFRRLDHGQNLESARAASLDMPFRI